MTAFRTIVSSTGVQMLGKLASLSLSILMVKLLAVGLGAEGYGYYTTALELVALFAALADFGLQTLAIRELSDKDRDATDIERVLGNVIGLRLLTTLLAVVLAITAAFAIPTYQDTPIPLGIVLASVALVLRMSCGPLNALLQVHYRMGRSVVAELTGHATRILWASVWVLLLGPHLGLQIGAPALIHWVIAGGIAGTFLQLAITLYQVRRLARPSMRLEWDYCRGFLRQSLPIGLSIMLGALYFRLDVLMLSVLRTPADVGIYGVAMRVLDSAGWLPVYFTNALLPAITAHLNAQNHIEIHRLLSRSWVFLAACALPVVAFTYLFATPLTLLLSSAEFATGGDTPVGTDTVLRIAIWTVLFSFLNRMFVYVSIAQGDQVKVLKVNAIGLLFNLVTNLILIPRYGLYAAAATTTASAALVLALNLARVTRGVGFRPPLRRSLLLLISALAVFGGCALLLGPIAPSLMQMITLGLLACAVYLCLAALTILLRPLRFLRGVGT